MEQGDDFSCQFTPHLVTLIECRWSSYTRTFTASKNIKNKLNDYHMVIQTEMIKKHERCDKVKKMPGH